MEEMYWITRLNGINVLLTIFALVSFIAAGLSLGMWTCDGIKTVKKWFITFVTLFLFLTISVIFVPTERDMYKIIGIGGAYDYLKTNQTAKGLPDKCIKALDKLVTEKDSITNEKNN